jgi:flagellar export protein FliJ
MNSKREKIQRVLELREKALEKRAGVLAKSRTKLQEAVNEAERESERLMLAAQHRATLTNTISDVGAWVEAEQWLAHRRNVLGRATGNVVKAEAIVAEDFQRVVTARIDKKKIELLDGRIVEAQTRSELRTEQKQSDEFAQRRRASRRGNE